MSFSVKNDRSYNSLRARYLLTPNNPYYTPLVRNNRFVVKRDNRWTSVEASKFSYDLGPYCGFTGPYAPDNWFQSITPSGSSGSSIMFNAPTSVNLTSSEGISGSEVEAKVCTDILNDVETTITFDWVVNATGGKISDHPFGYMLNDTFIQVTDDSGPDIQSGTVTITVDTAGLCITQKSIGAGTGTCTITNFCAEQISPGPNQPPPVYRSQAAVNGNRWVNFGVAKEASRQDLKIATGGSGACLCDDMGTQGCCPRRKAKQCSRECRRRGGTSSFTKCPEGGYSVSCRLRF